MCSVFALKPIQSLLVVFYISDVMLNGRRAFVYKPCLWLYNHYNRPERQSPIMYGQQQQQHLIVTSMIALKKKIKKKNYEKYKNKYRINAEFNDK